MKVEVYKWKLRKVDQRTTIEGHVVVYTEVNFPQLANSSLLKVEFHEDFKLIL